MVNSLKRTTKIVAMVEKLAVDHPQETVRAYDIKHYIDGVLRGFNHLLDNAQHIICFDVENDFEVYGLPGALLPILSNLISNSLSHGFEYIKSGDISIEVFNIDQ